MYRFIVGCVLAGLGGALGSVVGNAGGRPGLWIGGVLGGPVLSTALDGIGALLGAHVPRRPDVPYATR